MASPQTIERNGRANWALMTAIHDALRRDLARRDLMLPRICRHWLPSLAPPRVR